MPEPFSILHFRWFNKISFLSSNQLLGKKLAEAKIDHKFNVFNDGHQWANWRERTDDILSTSLGNDFNLISSVQDSISQYFPVLFCHPILQL